MAGTIRAAVLVKPETLEMREFARPSIGPDDALLRIEACGICGSDYEQFEGHQPLHEDYTPYPVIPGHEPLGIIEEIGALARQRWGVSEGDRVAVRSGYGCGRCEACRRFEPRACPARDSTRPHPVETDSSQRNDCGPSNAADHLRAAPRLGRCIR
jgi:threonine dehydrogenase-like Zn-dependent dehydrogenase